MTPEETRWGFVRSQREIKYSRTDDAVILDPSVDCWAILALAATIISDQRYQTPYDILLWRLALSVAALILAPSASTADDWNRCRAEHNALLLPAP